MVTVVQKSKKSARTTEWKMTVNEAKEFLYNIDARSFRINEYMVFSVDDKNEINSIKNYFHQDYLEEIEVDDIKGLIVNENVSKYDRLRNQGASIKSIKNFEEKIQDELDDSEVSIIFKNDNFEILIQHEKRDLKIVCSYQLEIEKALVLNKDWEFVDISENDEIVKLVNRIFRKQRYYYKQKNG